MPKMKKVSPNADEIRIITTKSLGYINYKNRYNDVARFNDLLPLSHRLKMEPRYLKVKDRLNKALKAYNLKSSMYFNKLLRAVLSWSDDIEFRAMEATKDAKKRDDGIFFNAPDGDAIKKDYDDLTITCEVMSSFIDNYIEENPDSKSICIDIWNKLDHKLSFAEKEYAEMKSNFKSNKAMTSRDKAVYEMYFILSKGLKPKDKNEPLYSDLFDILKSVYGLAAHKGQDTVAPMRAAVSRHKDKIKLQV